ncbi:MAG: hypothetical protein AB7J35_03355 [Dehalococcoidia bacterium]
MTSVWVESVGRSLDQAIEMLASSLRDCPDSLWEASMWPVPAPKPEQPFLGADWKPVTDPAERAILAERWAERWSTPWSVAWHALEVLDYDLNGELSPWMPPPPFAGHPHWRDLPSLAQPWSRAELLGYVDYCREQARTILAGMTEEKAATPLPRSHRYGGQPYASNIVGLVVHTTEHAAQIRQFVTGAGAAREL